MADENDQITPEMSIEEEEGFNPETDEILAYIPLEDSDQLVNDDNDEEYETMEQDDDFEPERDDCVLSMTTHSGDVFVVDVSGRFAASGGEDDKAIVWDFTNGNVQFECIGHSDSVTSVKFNSKSTLLATGDMSGLVQVWDVKTGTLQSKFQESADLEWFCWHHTADIMFIGAKDGLMWMWLVPNGTFKVYNGHGLPCTAGILLPDGKRLLAGYGDGVAKIWDLKEQTPTTVTGVSSHATSVTCLDVHDSQPLAAIGALDGTVTLIQTELCKITNLLTVDVISAESEANSIETIRFCPANPWLAVCTVQGDLNLLDINTLTIRHKYSHPAGLVKCRWIDSNCLVTACLDGILRLYDGRNGQIITQLMGHTREILDFAISVENNAIITGSADRTCRVFRLPS